MRGPAAAAYLPGMGRLFLLFTAVPLLELWLLIQVGQRIGPTPTIALVLLTGIVGAWLAKAEGFRVVRQWQRAIAEGRLPEDGILSGLLVLAGGLLLITPGVLTDVVGLALLVPPIRRRAAGWLRGWALGKVRTGQIRVTTFGGRPGGPPHGDRPPDVIDVNPPPRSRPPSQ